MRSNTVFNSAAADGFDRQFHHKCDRCLGALLDPVRTTTERYGTDGLLIGRIIRQDNEEKPRSLNWFVEVGDDRFSGEVTATSPDWLAEPLVEQLMAQLAKQYSVTAGDENVRNTLMIKVEKLSKLKSCFRVGSVFR